MCIILFLYFTVGKQVIHPNQISVVQTAFSPTRKSMEWAEGVISSFKEHEAGGKVKVLFC